MGKANITLKMKRKKGSLVYTITLHGHGSVVYKSGNHVKMKDIQDIPIKKKDFIDLLTEYENFPFPEENKIYQVDENTKDDYTYIAFTIKHSNGEIEEKEIQHYNKDEKISPVLKKLEDKTDNLTKTKQWLKNIQNKTPETKEKKKTITTKPKKQKTKEDKRKTTPAKPVTTKVENKESIFRKIKISPKIVTTIIVIIALLALIYVFIIDTDPEEKTTEPKINIIASKTTGENPLMINFNASLKNLDNPRSFYWDFGDKINSSKLKTTHTYLKPGEYTVVFSVVDSEGNVYSKSVDVLVD